MADVQDGQRRGGSLQFDQSLERESGVAPEFRPLIVELRPHLTLGEAAGHAVVFGQGAVESLPESAAQGHVEGAHVGNGETDHRGGQGQSGSRGCRGRGRLLGLDRRQEEREHQAERQVKEAGGFHHRAPGVAGDAGAGARRERSAWTICDTSPKVRSRGR